MVGLALMLFMVALGRLRDDRELQQTSEKRDRDTAKCYLYLDHRSEQMIPF